MKLKKLTLKNFRGFKHFECEFKPEINVLVGLNGSGKTTVLEAITVAYGQFMSGFGTSTDRGISVNEVYLAKVPIGEDDFSMEHQLPTGVAATTDEPYTPNFPKQWERFRNSIKKNSKTTIVRPLKDSAAFLQKMVQNGALPSLPLVAYYGTDRLWNQSFNTLGSMPKLSSTSRLEGYTDWLKPKSSYKSFVNWLYQETMASFEREMEIREQKISGSGLVKSNPSQERLDALREALNKVLMPSNWSNVRYSSKAKQVVATHPEQGDVPVSLLSDGVRNMLGMVADIAFRAIRLNPHNGKHVLKSIEGIVLIDELDMHLHPQWQQTVLQSLNEAFPKIQFIATTHSPQVIGGIEPESVHIIKKGDDHHYFTENPHQAYGLTSNDILNEIMLDTSVSSQLSRNKDVEQELEEIFELIANQNYKNASVNIENLEQKLGGEIPELVKAKLSIDLSEWDD